jgi:hypothetical protein
MGSLLFSIPDPDIGMKDIHKEIAFGRSINPDSLQLIFRAMGNPLIDFDRLRLCSKACRVFPPAGFGQHNDRLRIGEINVLIFVDIDEEGFSQLVYISQKRRILTKKSISSDPVETDIFPASRLNEFQG